MNPSRHPLILVIRSIAAAILLAAPTPTIAQCIPQPITRMGGAITQVAYHSPGVTLVARGQFLDRVDTANPFAPVVTSTLDMGERISDLAISGGNVFVSHGGVIDSFDPTTSPPTPLFSTTMTGFVYSIEQMLTAGSRDNPLLIVKTGQAPQTRIYGIGSGGNLLPLSTINTGGTLGIAGSSVTGNTFIISSYVTFSPPTQFFTVYEVPADPFERPVQRGTWQAPGSYGFQHSVLGNNSTVWVGIGPILHTFSIANPDAPVRLSTVNVGNEITHLAIGGSLFASTQASFGSSTGSGMKVLSILNPSSPSVIGTFSTTSPVGELAIGSSRAHLACTEGGLQIVNIATPASPAFMGGLTPAPGRADHISISGNTAFVSAGTMGVWIIDITNPATPLVRSRASSLNAHSTTVVGNRLYIADGHQGMRIYDITNLNSPVLRSTFNPPGTFETLHVGVTGNTAVMCNVQGTGSAEIVDITNDAAPVLRSTINNGDYFFDVAFWGTRAYFANSRFGVSVYDLANPAAPIQRYLGTPISSQCRSIAASAETVYALTGGTFQLIDFTTPAFPLLIGQPYGATGGADDFRIVGDKAYLATINGTRILDLSLPSRPTIITDLPSPEYPESIAVHSSGRIVEGCGLNGLAFYNPLTQWAPAPREGTQTRTVCPRSTIELTATFSSNPAPTSFTWFKPYTGTLVDGPTPSGAVISGSGTATLRIFNASAFDDGDYICTATNTCGPGSANPFRITVCTADHNCSGSVTVQDIFDYLNDYFSGFPPADINRTGTITVQDIFDFLAAYFAGC